MNIETVAVVYVVPGLVAFSRAATRLQPLWAAAPERWRPWIPAAVAVAGSVASLALGSLSTEEALVAVVPYLVALVAPGLAPKQPPKPPGGPLPDDL